MNLGDLINNRGVVWLDTQKKSDVLEQLIEALSRRKEVTGKEKLRRAIKDREKILSTGIGSGIAVPHAKIAEVKKFCAVVGISETGLPFESLGRQARPHRLHDRRARKRSRRLPAHPEAHRSPR